MCWKTLKQTIKKQKKIKIKKNESTYIGKSANKNETQTDKDANTRTDCIDTNIHIVYIIYKIIYVFILAVSGFYYGLNAGVTPADAESYCQSIGLRLAVLETLAEYEEAKTFLEKYKEEYGE